MAEYIERSSIKYEQWAVGPLCEPLMVVRKKTIDAIPAADVAPVVHGEWIIEEVPNTFDTRGNPYKIARCSCCGFQWSDLYSVKTYFKGCPNCLAKMDKPNV